MIKKRISTIIVIYICFVLQTTIFQQIKLADIVPNLLLIVTVSTAYMRGQTDGLFTGFLCGLVSDMVFGSVIGLYALIFMFIGYVVGYSNRIYYSDDFTIPLILVGISDFVYSLLYYVFEFLLRGRTDFVFYFTRIILPEIVYTLLVTVIVFKFLHSLDQWLTPKKKEEA